METPSSSPSLSAHTTTTATTSAAADAAASTTDVPTPISPPEASPAGLIPIEIVSEEEMAFIEAALSSTSRAFLLSASRSSSAVLLAPCSASRASTLPYSRVSGFGVDPILGNARSLHSTATRKPLLAPVDIEELGVGMRNKYPPRRARKKALSVTDITSAEWCEKQMEFVLTHGKPAKTEAMRAGSNRHVELEEEVITRVTISTKSDEDRWAVKFLNFIVGANQLQFDRITRELPVLGLLEGVWVTGVIDEIRLPTNEHYKNPLLVDTKTRRNATLPSEAQKRNARLQMMCYKYLWDKIVTDCFPLDQFFKDFGLNPESNLSDEVKKYSASLGFQSETFQDVATHFRCYSCLLSPSEDELLLRYEFQADNSLLDEYKFMFDDFWFKGQVQKTFQFLSGQREAAYVSDDERFKCNYCPFVSKCPSIVKSGTVVK